MIGYEHLIEDLHLPEPNDRHVLAAAIRGRADVIVTRNVKDFPAEPLSLFGIEEQHPGNGRSLCATTQPGRNRSRA